MRAVQGRDPKKGTPLAISTPGVAWTNGPTLVKADKALSLVREGKRATKLRKRAGDGDLVAAAQAGGGSDGPRPVDPQVAGPSGADVLPCKAFVDVSAMLERLRMSGKIDCADVFAPAGDELEQRDGINAWAFPAVPVIKRSPTGLKINWHMRDFGGRDKLGQQHTPVRRAALVVCIQVGEASCFWLEVEPRPYKHDRYRSLVFALADAAAAAEVVRKLLLVGSERGGKWPNLTFLYARTANAGGPGLAACTSWAHVRPRTGLLSGEAAFEAIRGVLPR